MGSTESQPLLVIVSGSPGSGKTTLATLLARELGLPLIAKDPIKERLMDVLGATDRDRSRELGRATFAVIYAVAGALLDAGSGLVLEANFPRGLAEAHLAPLVARSRAVLVHCRVANALARERYAARAARCERHAGHFDALTVATWPDATAETLSLAIPIPEVDTSDGYRPSLEDIAAFIRTASHGRSSFIRRA